MNNLCRKCCETLDPVWTFCPHCGKKPDASTTEIAPAGHDHEPAPVTGAFSGTIIGFIAVPVGLLFGIMLCLTGWGIFIGIPVIFLAILAPLAGPLVGLGAAKDKVL
ncbi:MAG TPA: hypothetical protein VGJ21_15370 [Terracidiphilus sp.]|jgi:hypothetical protein